MFPSISDYISSIEGAADTLSTLNYLRPVRKPNGQPYFSSGNFAVVFKMQDSRNGGHMALKCFLRDVPDRARRLRLIGEWIADNPSPYLLSMTYHADELWVDCAHSDREEFDVVMMPWVEGVTLEEYVRGLCEGDPVSRELGSNYLKWAFDTMACWLLYQQFAHGDIKPDNIIINGVFPKTELYLVDYDGCFVPSMNGQEAIETGTPPYQHPDRTALQFDHHIDDFSLLALSLEIYALNSDHGLFAAGDSLVLSTGFAQQPFDSPILDRLRNLKSKNVSARTGLLEFAIHTKPGEIEGLRKLWPKVIAIKKLRKVENRAKIELLKMDVFDFPELIPYRINDKWGFVSKNKNIRVDTLPC